MCKLNHDAFSGCSIDPLLSWCQASLLFLKKISYIQIDKKNQTENEENQSSWISLLLSILWCSQIRSSISWFSQIWLLTKYEWNKYILTCFWLTTWTMHRKMVILENFLNFLNSWQKKIQCVIEFWTKKLKFFTTWQNFSQRKVVELNCHVWLVLHNNDQRF